MSRLSLGTCTSNLKSIALTFSSCWHLMPKNLGGHLTIATPPFRRIFLMGHVWTVPENVHVKFEVRNFNHFKLVWLINPLRAHTQTETDFVHLVEIITPKNQLVLAFLNNEGFSEPWLNFVDGRSPRSVSDVIHRPASPTYSLIRSSRPSTGRCSMPSRSFRRTSRMCRQNTTFNTLTLSSLVSRSSSPRMICKSTWLLLAHPAVPGL